MLIRLHDAFCLSYTSVKFHVIKLFAGKNKTVAGCYGDKVNTGCRDTVTSDIVKPRPKTVKGKTCYCNRDNCNGELTDTFTIL